VPVQYSYTSTPPIGRTACTDPQFLYSTAIPLLPLWAVLPVQSLSALQGCTLPFTFLQLLKSVLSGILLVAEMLFIDCEGGNAIL